MPELKGRKVSGFVKPKTVTDVNAIKYTDKKKESSRQEKLAVYKESGQWPGAKKKAAVHASENTVAWSQKGNNKRSAEDDEDDDDLEDDFRLLKRLKKGKAGSQQDFDKNIELDALEEEVV